MHRRLPLRSLAGVQNRLLWLGCAGHERYQIHQGHPLEWQSRQPKYADDPAIEIFLGEILSKESKEVVEDLIVAAHNDAKSKLKKKTSEEISKITGGIDLPPGFKIPF